jgi:hypothetical protein
MTKGWTDDGIGKGKKPNLLYIVIVRRKKQKRENQENKWNEYENEKG